MFDDIIGKSFVFAHNDDDWKAKRKACAHAFYKDRLVFMLETLKDKTEETFGKWAAQINSKGSHEVNMATEFSEILARNIVHVSFGEDLCDEKITLKVREGDEYVPKEMTIKEAIYIIIDQVCFTFYTNVTNPINWLYPYTEKIFQISSETKHVKENCLHARNWIKDYIEKRRAGKRRSSVAAETDILSLMLARPDVFTDEVIIDELLGFFGAATETTHNVMKTIVTYFTKAPESLAKVRSEFD